jgi:DnaK suppressor protein
MKTSNGVNKEILEKLKKKLEQHKAKIEKELATIAEKDEKMKGDYDTRFPDFGTPQSTDESALEVTAYESALPLEYALELRLADINKALEKIKNGQYGQCEKCGESIDPKRLEAIPEAKYCIKHQK